MNLRLYVRALANNKGRGCFECRSDCGDAGVATPCDQPGGILPTDEGQPVCTFGFPALLPGNALALELWRRAQALGWDVALALTDLELRRGEGGDLADKLEAITDETAAAARRKKPDVNSISN